MPPFIWSSNAFGRAMLYLWLRAWLYESRQELRLWYALVGADPIWCIALIVQKQDLQWFVMWCRNMRSSTRIGAEWGGKECSAWHEANMIASCLSGYWSWTTQALKRGILQVLPCCVDQRIKEHWCEVEYLSSAYWTLLKLIALHPRLAKWRLEIVMGWDGGHGQRRQMDYPNGINSHLLRPIVEEVPIEGIPKPGSVLGLGWVS